MTPARKVLLVEDDKPISDSYAFKLRLGGIDVVQAFDGLEGLHAIKNTPDFKLILLDLRMPRMGGEEFLEQLRKIDAYKEIPVLILTNISRQEAPRTIWHLGISEYLVKVHTQPKELLEIVEKYLAKTE